MKKQIVLCILDGFGVGPKNNTNAIYTAKTPNFDSLFKNYLYREIEASGIYVGLVKNQMGNSEVGHLTIGSGRINLQFYPLINEAIKNKEFFENKAFIDAIGNAKKNNSTLHLLGICSHGCVHGDINHLYALIDLVKKYDVKTNIHFIADGRDTSRDVAYKDMKILCEKISSSNKIQIASIHGRFYAMDRDKRWDRIDESISVLFRDKNSKSFSNALEYISEMYNQKIYDEFIVPAYNNKIDSAIQENDSVICFNFRQDRAIEICSCLTNPNYQHKSKYFQNNLFFVSMRKYSDDVIGEIAFSKDKLKSTLGEFISKSGYTQLRIAETEKYAHVTYFFDGGININYPKEKRILINSPRVKTYDLCPEMSANKITAAILKEIGKHDLIVLNLANADMVGHTGNFAATCKAIEVLDKNIGLIANKTLEEDYHLIITADHGNAEDMKTSDGKIVKKHTNNKIPLCIVGNDIKKYEFTNNMDAGLANIASTILFLMNSDRPIEINEPNLLQLKGKNNA